MPTASKGNINANAYGIQMQNGINAMKKKYRTLSHVRYLLHTRRLLNLKMQTKNWRTTL
jgi:hypothetical protein